MAARMCGQIIYIYGWPVKPAMSTALPVVCTGSICVSAFPSLVWPLHSRAAHSIKI